MQNMTRLTTTIAAAALLVACGASPKGLDRPIQRTTKAPTATAAATDPQVKLVKEGDDAWEKRVDRAQLELAIRKWEEAVKLRDDDYQTYAKLARASYLLADGWLAFEPAKKTLFLATHERGYGFALRGLAAASPDFEKRILAGTNIENAIKVVGRNGVPLIYWYGSNLGKWAKARGFTTILKYKDRIFGMVDRVYELDPDFFYGAADRYFGAFYAIAPSFAGGDVHKSYEHFQASLKRAPNYLGTYVLAAEFYAPKNQDPKMYETYLTMVVNAKPCGDGVQSPCIMPELAPEAAIEQKKAAKLLKEKDDKF